MRESHDHEVPRLFKPLTTAAPRDGVAGAASATSARASRASQDVQAAREDRAREANLVLEDDGGSSPAASAPRDGVAGEASATPRRVRLRRRVLAVVAAVVVLLVAGVGVTARYVMMQDREAEMIAAGFHMSSDTLREVAAPETAPAYVAAPEADGSFVVRLYNWEVDNVASVSEVDIGYTVTVEGGTLRSTEPVTLASSGDEVAAADGVRTLPAGSASAKVTHELHIVPTSQEVTVTVRATDPYEKTVVARFAGGLPSATGQAGLARSGLTAQVEADPATGMSLVTVQTNQFEGTLRLTWPPGMTPAAGVVNGPEGWDVDYAGRAATIEGAGKLETYEFEFVGTPPAAPAVTVESAAGSGPKTATVALSAAA